MKWVGAHAQKIGARAFVTGIATWARVNWDGSHSGSS
jgi:hypothetical protein